ncbi:MAG TPA: hypothetical protein VJS30_09110 [Paraburkholderia sp.]|nr:hypothetical protein [Paraburkholderia sp.]
MQWIEAGCASARPQPSTHVIARGPVESASASVDEQQFVNASGEVAADQVEVFHALGGGWDGAAQRAADLAKAAAESRHDGEPADGSAGAAGGTGGDNTRAADSAAPASKARQAHWHATLRTPRRVPGAATS